jgi:hypothetical protein
MGFISFVLIYIGVVCAFLAVSCVLVNGKTNND